MCHRLSNNHLRSIVLQYFSSFCLQSLSLFLFFSLSVFSSFCLLVFLSFRLSVFSSFCLFVFLSIHLSFFQSSCLSSSKFILVHHRVAQVVAPWHPGCEKWKKNEKMKRKQRENEEMERDSLGAFPHFLFISSLPIHFLYQKLSNFVAKC